MAHTPVELFAYLDRCGIKTETMDHAPVFTVDQSRRLRGLIPGAHTKNLFLRDNKRSYFLICLNEERSVDLKALRPLIGARGGLSFASAEALFDHLGVLPGSVSPFAAINDADGAVKVVLEAELMSATVVNCHPLTNTKSTSIAPQDLWTFLRATGHEPTVISMTEQSEVGAAD